MDPQLERQPQVDGPPDQQPGLGGLGSVQQVLGAVAAPAALGRVRAEPGIAQFLAPEGPVNEVPDGRLLRPLPR